jgi:hypothetical protein
MTKYVFQKKLRTLGGADMVTKGFSVPHDIRKEMGLEEGDMLKITIEKEGKEE